jgi:tetratricopeptide (TPR) repeat protein
LDELEARDADDPEVALLRSEILLEEGKLDESRQRLLVLTRVETAEGEPERVAAAAYLLGRCEGRRGDNGAAERAYERAADLAPESIDGIRGALAAARLLQAAGRDEEAFSLFRRAITSQSAGDPPPVPEEEMRRTIREGWDAWVEDGVFDRAVSLAVTAEPVLGTAESVRLQAQGRVRAAAAFEALWKAGKATGPQEGVRELNDRWKASGEAYRALAEAVTDSASIGEALSTAADHFSRGRAFEEADGALTDLLDLKLPRLEAAVLARRGRVRLDLGRPQAAAEDFRTVLGRHPTDPVAFEARVSLGRCYLEQGNVAKAESTWRELLSLEELTPDASEWRSALFALAELLHRRGVAALARAERDGTEAVAAQAEHASAVAALDEAINRFGEYVRRAGESEQLIEARVLRADAMRRRAEVSLGRAAAAETESMRDVHVRESERLLRGAVMEFRAVQSVLAPQEDGGRLPRLERELLKSTAFDLGHAFAALGSHHEAIVAYGAAVNRYPDDPRVLPAYLRMAESYRQLKRTDDARAAIEQARLVLGQMPVSALGAGSSLDRAGWEEWLDRAKNIDSLPMASPPAKEL